MTKLVDESGSIYYLCVVLVGCAVMYSFLVERYVYTFLVKKVCCPSPPVAV